MNNSKAEFTRLRLRFVTLAAVLKQPKYAPCCGRTLAYWTSISDHAIPYALIDYTIQDILAMGFDTIAATPGVGSRKIDGLLQILERIRLSNDGTTNISRNAVVPSIFFPDGMATTRSF